MNGRVFGAKSLGLVSFLPSVHLERWVLEFLEMSHSLARLRRAQFEIHLRLPLRYWLTKGAGFLRTNEFLNMQMCSDEEGEGGEDPKP